MASSDADRKHQECMDIARWIAERKEELFIAEKDRISDSIKESAWRHVLKNCIDSGQVWMKTNGGKEKNWAYLRDNKWTMIKASVRRHLAGNGPSKSPMKEYMDELTNFILDHDLLDPLKDKISKPSYQPSSSGGRITIKAETDITDQFRIPTILPNSRNQFEEPMQDPQPFLTLSEALNAATSSSAFIIGSAQNSREESLDELQKKALRAAIKRDEALADAARQVQKYYEGKMRFENGGGFV
ncbi:hypothetical protein L596_019448 [Steinernema carpocapsae]|uniref:Regulatory protein zeste n=1 Tax=Steinernema carpocapsae TaxID=34508 RepID=A0A4U5MQQ6_STECR|nr:hypothetical protein L596_019448 [Steinernema carpocapsae]